MIENVTETMYNHFNKAPTGVKMNNRRHPNEKTVYCSFGCDDDGVPA